jgi:putative sterol carrier protein
MSLIFPSEAWFVEDGERINASDEYRESASDWGVGFDGDFLFVMADVPVKSVDDELPDDLAAEMDRYIEDGTGYGFLGLEAGECTRAEFVTHDDPAVEEAGFVMTATYDVWSRVIDGDTGAVDGLMTGQFDLDGDMQKIMAYSEAATLLTDLSAEIDAETVTERYG